jgi:putative NIF3 family GTP cyclohydrolase 1 type 2
MTVREIVNAIIQKTGRPALPLNKTCDQLMTGSFDAQVTSVVTTFMATVDVVRQAAKEGADLIITHEPTWFTGRDDTDWIKDDPVFIEKKKLIEASGISIWRFHDQMHMADEDGIYRGLIAELGWKEYITDDMKSCFEIPEVTLGNLALFLKEKLSMDVIQYIGSTEMKIKRVGILVGGGSLGLGVEHMPMEFMKHYNVDCLICGDITEWTLPAYARDAAYLGFNKSLIIAGHERTEEAGMKHLVEWLEPLLGAIPVHFIDSREPFRYL